MSQIDNVARFLKTSGRNKTGVTTAQIAKAARMPRDSVRKRIHDLRNDGFKISSMVKLVNGTSKTYYRLLSA